MRTEVVAPPSAPWGPDGGDFPSIHLVLGMGRGVSPTWTFWKLPAPRFLLELEEMQPGWGSPAWGGGGAQEIPHGDFSLWVTLRGSQKEEKSYCPTGGGFQMPLG